MAIKTMINKKNLLIFTLTISLIGIVVNYSRLTYDYCPSTYVPCTDLVYDGLVNFLIFIPLLLFSLITYRMRESIYRAWVRFVYVWIPLSMILIFLAPEYSNDWMFPVTKASVAFVTFWIFVIISSLIIIYQYIATRGKGK